MNDDNFPVEYEEFISKSTEGLLLPIRMTNLLKEKRDLGLKKYGEISFQSNLHNAMKVDTIQHAKEELIDYMNYSLHEIFKNSRIGDFAKVWAARERFKKAYELYKDTE